MSRSSSLLHLPLFDAKVQRGFKSSCDICSQHFSIFKKQHLCKRCNRAVCADCSPFKVKTYLGNRKIKLHRMCNKCSIESNKIKNYIENHQLKWATDSDLVYVWKKLIGKDANKISKINKSVLSYVSLDNVWLSFNFSFREFISIVVEKKGISDEQLLATINDGIDQIQNHYEEMLIQGLYIYLFFLCHAQKQIALNFTLFILALINNSSKFKFNDLALFLVNQGFTEIQSSKICNFMEKNKGELIFGATSNSFPIILTLEIISLLIKVQDVTVLWKYVAFTLLEVKSQVLKQLDNFKSVTNTILKNAHCFNLRPRIKQFNLESNQINDISSYQIENSILVQQSGKEVSSKLQLQKTYLEKELKQLEQSFRSQHEGKIQDNYLDSKGKMLDKLSINNEKIFENMIRQKNEQITLLKQESNKLITNYQYEILHLQQIYQRQKKQIFERNEQIKQKVNKIKLIEDENINLQKMNSCLANKLTQFSSMLAKGKQKKQFHLQIDQKQQNSHSEQQQKKQCTMF